ncbi:MAG TPA: zinc-binding dehydrogenase [Burkholderiales bacterium]|nr:zinc-binding dehydrogenase [Burkholderiales bacterium]
MKAAVFAKHGLELRDVSQPQPKAGEALVRVRYAGLNRRDLTRSPGDEGQIPGMDWSGERADTGEAVMCMGAGGYAEYACSACVLPVPKGVDLEQAAALPLALLTMHDAIVGNGRLRRGESVLILGAASAVGLIGLQIAKLLGAAVVIGTSRKPEHRERLHEHGADLALDTADERWVQSVLEATGGKGADLVIDQVSGRLFNATQKATAIRGRIVNVGRLGGMNADFDFNLHALRRIQYIGVTFRTRTPAEVAEIAQRMRADLWPGLEAGKLRLPVDKTFPLGEAEAAQARMRADQHFGKILLRI